MMMMIIIIIILIIIIIIIIIIIERHISRSYCFVAEGTFKGEKRIFEEIVTLLLINGFILLINRFINKFKFYISCQITKYFVLK